MSDAVSALNGRVAAGGFATVAEAGLTGMLTIRAEFGSGALKAALGGLGLAVPGQRGVVTSGGRTLAWMSPDELLLICGYDEAPGLATTLGDALAGEHALVVNVSDARARFTVSGPRADEVVMKLAPVDFATLPQGEIRRTRTAQIAAALWRSGPEEITLVCFRSVGLYLMNLLETAARKGGEIF